jgi:hypothetical protein
MAAAYATIGREQVPRATPMLNVLQRVGGSLGTAVLAVVLERQIATQLGGGAGSGSLGAVPDAARARVAAPLATAFAHTYWWTMAMTALALVPAAVLAVTERRAARERKAAAASESGREGAHGARAASAAADGATPPAPDRAPRPGHAPARLR